MIFPPSIDTQVSLWKNWHEGTFVLWNILQGHKEQDWYFGSYMLRRQMPVLPSLKKKEIVEEWSGTDSRGNYFFVFPLLVYFSLSPSLFFSCGQFQNFWRSLLLPLRVQLAYAEASPCGR